METVLTLRATALPCNPESFERKRDRPAERAKEKVTFPSVADLVEKMLSPSAPTGVTS